MPMDYTILGKYVFSELSSFIGKLRLSLALMILPKNTSHFFHLVLEKISDDISKLEEKKRNGIVAYLKLEVEIE